MRLHYLQHVPFEGLGEIRTWAEERGHQISSTRLYLGEKLPLAKEFHWLVILGGPMNVYEDDKYPWLADEKKFILDAIEAGKIVMGICLGAQLMADVLGGKVQRNEHPEIGWYNVVLTPEAIKSPLFRGFPAIINVFQWHGDTFDIPPGAVRLGVSKACPNQGFEDGRAIGLQFHLEYSLESIQSLIQCCGEDLVEGKYVQRPEEMLLQADKIEAANGLLETLLDDMERAFDL
jgi:GMP synthase-like glutamine amidotransferase